MRQPGEAKVIYNWPGTGQNGSNTGKLVLEVKTVINKRDQFIAACHEILPSEAVITDQALLSPYECDALTMHRSLPMVVFMPDKVEQVQALLKRCHEHGVPVVARGAGTGLSGGARPNPDAALISLAKFTRILEVDPVNRTAKVEPGVRNIVISETVAEHGLFYAPDPSSQIACTIGGNVAENSGGVHCLKYGLTVHNIQSVTMLTMEGELLEIGGDTLDTPGYDLLALATGSEGLLGIIVAVTVKLIPVPDYVQVIMVSFDDIENAGNAVAAVIAEGIIPAGLEMMDKLTINAAEDFIHAGYPAEAEAILLCELDGTEEEVETQIERVASIMKTHHAIDSRVAKDEAERQKFWAGRKASFPAVGRLAPDYYCVDGTIPRKHLASVLHRINEIASEHGLLVANVFHAGDGNLHPLILYDANKPGDLEHAEAVGTEILEHCVEVGGTVTGEHGVGTEKLKPMCVQFNAPELEQFHAIKAAFDPDGLLNPGKAVPTLQRCAELGAMHVHHGELPFPDLERF